MSRIHRVLLLAVLALTLGLAVAPAQALEPITIVYCRTAVGAGDTESEAIENAVDILATRLWFSSYTVLSSFCSEEEIYTGNPRDPYDTIVLCSAQVKACGVPKPQLP